MSNSPSLSPSTTAEQPLIEPRDQPSTSQPSAPQPSQVAPTSRASSPAGTRRVILFSCLNGAWLKLGYPKGTFNQAIMNFVFEEAKTFDVHRTVARRNLRYLYFNFLRTKNIAGFRKGGPKVKQLNEEIEFLLNEPKMSMRRCSKELSKEGIKCTENTIRQKAKKMGLKFYRKPVGQQLEDHHCDMRETFATKFMHMRHNNELLPENIIWSDECMLSVGPHINRKNDGR